MNGKRGNIAWDTVVHLIIIALVVSGVLWFIHKQSGGSFAYEEIYAKEIGLIIDSAKPNMQVSIDFEKGYEIADKNKKTTGLVTFSDNLVSVSLTQKGNYNFRTFSDYNVEFNQDKTDNQLIIIVGEKK